MFRGHRGASGHAASDLYCTQPNYLVFLHVLQITVVVLAPSPHQILALL